MIYYDNLHFKESLRLIFITDAPIPAFLMLLDEMGRAITLKIPKSWGRKAA